MSSFAFPPSLQSHVGFSRFLLHTYLGLTLPHRSDDAGESFIQSARRSAKRRETTNSASASLPVPNPPPSFSSVFYTFYQGFPQKINTQPFFLQETLGDSSRHPSFWPPQNPCAHFRKVQHAGYSVKLRSASWPTWVQWTLMTDV